MLKQLLNQCTVHLSLEALEPLLVKSGSAVVTGPDMAFVRTSRHGHFQPFLPGTSLKGVLRSHAERIARTMKHESVCDVFSKKHDARIEGCGTYLPDRKDLPDYRDSYKDSCPACRLFGSLRWKGRFSIGDAYLTEDFEDTEPELRDGIGIDRVSGGVAGGAKFDMEVLPAGVQFEARIDVVNYELWQLGWLAYVLRDLSEGFLGVGLGTSRGLGRVRAKLDSMTLAYIGEPDVLQTRIPGIGALVSASDREAYGLVQDDYVARPDAVVFSRPAGSLRARVEREGHENILPLLATVAPAWDQFIPNQPAIQRA